MNYAKQTRDFSAQMLLQLNANTPRKGDFTTWHPDVKHLMSEVHYHLNKLTDAIAAGDRSAVSEYAADVANYMMKAHQDFGVGPCS